MQARFTVKHYDYSMHSGKTRHLTQYDKILSSIDEFFEKVEQLVKSYNIENTIETFPHSQAVKAKGKKLQIFYASKEDIKKFGSNPRFETQQGCSAHNCLFIYQIDIKEEDNLTFEAFESQLQKRFPQQTTNKIPSATRTSKQEETAIISPEPPKPSNTRSEAENKAIDALKNLLTLYMKRVESYKSDYASGFWFYSASRAINRKANYYLAKHLVEQINTHADIATLFSDEKIKSMRLTLIEKYRLNESPDYVERGLNSEELNNIIKQAHLSFPTHKVINSVSNVPRQTTCPAQSLISKQDAERVRVHIVQLFSLSQELYIDIFTNPSLRTCTHILKVIKNPIYFKIVETSEKSNYTIVLQHEDFQSSVFFSTQESQKTFFSEINSENKKNYTDLQYVIDSDPNNKTGMHACPNSLFKFIEKINQKWGKDIAKIISTKKSCYKSHEEPYFYTYQVEISSKNIQSILSKLPNEPTVTSTSPKKQ